jgi:hypothetical protein
MQPYVKIYMDYFGYGEQDFIPCECCTARASDIHHIIFRSQGGTDDIKNLMALCRRQHDQAQAREIPGGELQYVHNCFMVGQRGIFIR